MNPFTINKHHVVWNEKSENSAGSMPVGGGDIGLNVWVEKNDIFFYLSQSGANDENGQLLKLGRCRISLTPTPFDGEYTFNQTLNLQEGCIDIVVNNEQTGFVYVKIWVEVYRPIIHVEMNANNPIKATVSYESWRIKEREIRDRDTCSNLAGYPKQIFTRRDHVEYDGNAVLFYHGNSNKYASYQDDLKLQGMQDYQNHIPNPTENLFFGGFLTGENMVATEKSTGEYEGIPFQSWKLESLQERINHHVRIALQTKVSENIKHWKKEIVDLLENQTSKEDTYAINKKWWNDFWNRSYIAISEDEKGAEISRNYHLFRYMLACNVFGDEPTKFNGGLFTFDPRFVNGKYVNETPDFRRWGGSIFTAQNQRLVYWPMLKSGDFDLMKPQFEFYRRILSVAEIRSLVYWGHEGAAFTEQISHTGLPSSKEYGWNRSEDAEPGVEDNDYVNYEYVHQLDFSFMILSYFDYSGEDISDYIPFIESSVRFFDEHYQYRHQKSSGQRLDENGHLVIAPSTAVETFKNAENPTDVIAGLQAVLQKLIQLPSEMASSSKKKMWLEMLDRIPPFTYEEKEGKRTLAPAKTWSHVQNVELPQLYPVFPFQLYGIGKPDLQTARNTWKYSVYHDMHDSHISWHQGNIFSARLGLTDDAKKLTIKKLSNGPHRFPSFWGPGHDWTPDHNWGGTGMIGLQEMLMQTNEKQIYMLPAWPEEWSVQFKLHAPFSTEIEGYYKDNKLVITKISPPERVVDLIVINGSKLEIKNERMKTT